MIELVCSCDRSLRLHAPDGDHIAYHLVMMEEVFRRAARFDLIHFHIDYLHFPLSSRLSYPHVTTLHGRREFSW